MLQKGFMLKINAANILVQQLLLCLFFPFRMEQKVTQYEVRLPYKSWKTLKNYHLMAYISIVFIKECSFNWNTLPPFKKSFFPP